MNRSWIFIALMVVAGVAVVISVLAGCRPAQEVHFALAAPSKPLLLITVNLNGQGPFRFILDTGASMTILTPEVAHRAGVSATKSAEGHGAGGKIAVALATVASFAVGGAVQKNLDVAITDLASLSAVTGTALDGIIGYNFLKHYVVTIHYRNKTLRLREQPGN